MEHEHEMKICLGGSLRPLCYIHNVTLFKGAKTFHRQI